jgi:hypothetical protein
LVGPPSLQFGASDPHSSWTITGGSPQGHLANAFAPRKVAYIIESFAARVPH